MKRQAILFSVLVVLAYVPRGASAAETDQGQKLYLQYCSSCHGRDGKANGPVAAYLKIKVPDLTQLKKKHKGVYPLDYVMSTIDGRRAVRAHGDREMPVWGEVFRDEVAKEKYKELTTLLTAKTIAEYVATLQR
jgi:mono/diheme cytochrome c family protein